MGLIPQHRRDRPKGGVLAKMYVDCQTKGERQEKLGTSSVPTEALESRGEVGVEILDGKVASEVTVGGRKGGKT